MRFFLLLLLSLFLAGSPGEARASSGEPAASVIVGGFPLMPGLTILPDETLYLFGSKRPSQTLAKGPVDVDEVYPFYARILEAAGWQPMSARLYVKGTQEFSIEAKSANVEGMTFVTFTLRPSAP